MVRFQYEGASYLGVAQVLNEVGDEGGDFGHELVRAARQVLHHVVQDLVDTEESIALGVGNLETRPQPLEHTLQVLVAARDAAWRFAE